LKPLGSFGIANPSESPTIISLGLARQEQAHPCGP